MGSSHDITAWRIYKPKHSASAFTGEGARLYGGRLNSKGRAVIYTSQSASLASLEMLVHLQASEILDAYVVRSVTFDESLVAVIALADLPRNWCDNPPPASIQQIGDDWLARAESAVLQVPSVLVESESNFLLNPNHPDFLKIQIGTERPRKCDPRLVKN